ncbi:type III polyketide synthase [Microbacterium immunditiarum]|uniref:Putative naringenin-chalcone synthase n=1 Tax=Microbacterium immunditiarum TaxID=337480 RepID=A0A7Y9GKT1_9MICO|nr:type III polyketide synthase [Microbacterium immunditiarum]NYE18345.1 putative naringenin-chalcone synthase [Microbacterium immunditiarum]
MAPRIVSVGTAVPATRVTQERVRELFTAQPGADRLAQRRIRAAFDAAAIETRHTVIAELGDGFPIGSTSGFLGQDGVLRMPTTGTRNDAYVRLAPPLSAEAARAAMTDAAAEASAITHVITVSCTGFFAPGPDYRLVRDLGLPATVERYHLGFIGCAAALPALRLAARICAAQPEAVVLVVCAELCSLHLTTSTDPQQIVAASVFADGAAAAVVTADPGIGGGGGLELDAFATALTSEGEDDMVWRIGDHGFEMVLSAEVPRIIGREIRGAVDRFLEGSPPPDAWAVHPGGRSVLDRVESGLELDPASLATSRAVLRDYGNMSSATVLFILRELLHDEAVGEGARIAGLAFGPGLTVESALMTRRMPRTAVVALDVEELAAVAAPGVSA